MNAYLTKPTTRLGRYNLLLREILKHTPAGHPDQELIPKAMNVISEFLSDVNHETGKMESKFSLQLLAEKLSYKAPIMVDERFMVCICVGCDIWMGGVMGILFSDQQGVGG